MIRRGFALSSSLSDWSLAYQLTEGETPLCIALADGRWVEQVWGCGQRRAHEVHPFWLIYDRSEPPQRALRAKIRFKFQAIVTRRHSPRTLSSPRRRNCRKPRTDLMMPNTGSGVCLRKP